MAETPKDINRAEMPLSAIRKKDVQAKPALVVKGVVVDDLVSKGIEAAKNPIAAAKDVWKAVGGN